MTAPSQLLNCLEALEGARVLCLGDVMLDRFVHGEVARISPEAPIPVFRVGEERAMLGGAGNVVRNLSGLGAQARLIAVIGSDAAGGEVTRHLEDAGAPSSRLITDGARRTSIKTRYIAANQQMLRADEEDTGPLSGAVRSEVMAALGGAIGDCDVLVLADYGKGVLADGLAAAAIETASARGIPVIVDPQGVDYGIYAGAHLIAPNLKELADAARADVGSEDAIEAAARKLMKTCGLDCVLATRSADGMTLFEAGGGRTHLAAEAREVFDVSGAGDTVVATLAAALAGGVALDQGAELANLAAGIVVGKLGTAVAYGSDLAQVLRHRELAGGEAKILTLAQALDRVRLWRDQGKTIGFTNGCFDLLHPGHLTTLAQAKAACDHLIVALNSDASVKRLKGEARPIQGEAARAQVLASLETVDLVIVFTEDTPAHLIEAIRPEVFIKGADYNVDEIPEARIVEGYGGRILLAELEDGHSTTATIQRMGK